MLGQQQSAGNNSIDIVAKLQSELNIVNLNLDTNRSVVKFYPSVRNSQEFNQDPCFKDLHHQGSVPFDRYFIQTKENLISCFATDSNQENSYSVELESKIELVQTLEESNILILGEKRGFLHFMNISSGEILQSQQILDASTALNGSEEMFAGITVQNMKDQARWDVLIAITSGLLVRIMIPIMQFTLDNQNQAFEEVKAGIHMEMIDSGLQNLTVVSSFTTIPRSSSHQNFFFTTKAIYQDDNVFILAQKENGLTLWARSGGSCTSQVNYLSGRLFQDDISKILVDSERNLLIVRGSRSWLYLIDLYSVTMIRKKMVQNLIDTNLIYGNSGEKDARLMVLLEGEQKCIQFYDVSTLTPISNVAEFPATSRLYFPPNYINNALCYDRNGKISLVSIQESDSMSVITRLIKEGKHDEAIAYTLQKSDNNLYSMENYYQLCLELNCHPKSITDTLSHITDPKILKSFAANYDFVEQNQATPKRLSSLQIIDMVLKCLSSLEPSQQVEDTKKDLKKMADRFLTFQMIDKKKRSFWGNDWHIFRTCNMQYSLQNAIASKDITTALLLIKRHFKVESLLSNLEAVLAEIPKSLEEDLMISLLEQLRSECVFEYEYREIIDQWVLNATSVIEKNDRNLSKCLSLLKWAERSPNEFSAKNPSDSLSPSYYISHLMMLSQEKAYKDLEIQQNIRLRIQEIEHIMELETRHNFKIALVDFQNTPLPNIAMSILDRVTVPELLDSCIETHLKPLSSKHGIDLDQVLVGYCKELMHSKTTPFSVWEPKVLKLLPQIKARCDRVSALLDMMRRSPLPWSEELDLLINFTINNVSQIAVIDVENRHGLQHQELLEQYKLMRLKKMLSERYGVKKFNVADITLAKKIVPFILKHVERLDAIQDAVLAMEVYNQATLSQICVIRACHLIEHSLLERFHNLLHSGAEIEDEEVKKISLSPEDLSEVLMQVGLWISERLDRMANRRSASLEHIQSIIKAGVILFDLANNENEKLVYENCLELSQLLLKGLSPKMMKMEDFRHKILTEAISMDNLEKVIVFKIGELLKFSQQQIVFKYASYYAHSSRWNMVHQSCIELDEKYPGSASADFIYSLTCQLIDSLKLSDPFLEDYKILMDIGQIALRNSDRSNVLKILDLCKRIEIFKRILFSTDLGAYQLSLNAAITNHKPHSLSRDNSLVMSSDALLPLMLAFLRGKENDKEASEKTMEAVLKCARDRNHHSALRLVHLLAFSAPSSEFDKNSTVVNNCLESIFEDLLISDSELDVKVALSSILLLPQATAIKLLNTCIASSAKDYKRLRRVAVIGSAAALYWSKPSLHSSCLDIIQYARWMNDFSLLGIHFDYSTLRPTEKTPGGSNHQRVLIRELLEKGKKDLAYVLEFSRQYLITDNFVYLEVIKTIVTSGVDLSCREVQAELSSAIQMIQEKDKLVKILQEHTSMMSPYDYEGLRLLFNEMCKLSIDSASSFKKSILALDVLMDYNRSESPDEIELQKPSQTSYICWNKHFSKSSKRLPYHQLFQDPLKVLAKEISESTLPRLIPLAPLLNLESDQYYEAIIQKKVEILQKMRSKAIDFSSSAISFNDFKPVILKIKDFEAALKITVYVAGSFPRGEDRIAAYRLALSMNERWISSLQKMKEEKLIEKAKTGCLKIKSMLGIAQTEYALQQNGLSILDEYVVNPNMLLTQLLTMNSKLKASPAIIHEIATGVATRGNIDLDKFKLVMLQKWLTNDKDENLNPSIDERVIFLLHGKFEWGRKHLLSFSTLPSSKITGKARVKALSCLVRLSSMPECSKMDLDKIQNNLQSALYLVEFESLGISQTLSQFESCDKHALARSLWVSHRSSIRGLQLICQLCIDYNIPDSVLGGNVFTLLLQESKELDFLLQILEKIAYTPLFAGLRQIWNEGLRLSILNWLSSHESIQKWTNYIDLLIKYPDVNTLELVVDDLEKYLSSQIELSEVKMMVVYALYCLNRHSALYAWINNLDKEDALYVLTHSSPETAALRVFLTNELYDRIDTQGLYTYLLGTDQWSNFVTFLIENDRIEKLFLASVRENRVDDALKLFKVYAQTLSPGSAILDDELLSLFECFVKERSLDVDVKLFSELCQ